MALRGQVLKQIADNVATAGRKITVVGAGNVGMAVVACLLTQGITNELCIIDPVAKKIEGEVKDFQHAANLINHARLSYSTDFACSKNSALGIITAGARRKPNETRLDLLKNNAEIIKKLVPQFVEHSPDATLLMITNPVDVMAYLAWKQSGWPAHRVIGSGTTIDSNRFRVLMAERLGLAPAAVKGAIIGEHGEHAVACFSSVCVGGCSVHDVYPDFGSPKDKDKWVDLKKETVKIAGEVIKLKGGTWWAIGLAAAHICHLILDNTLHVTPVSTNVNGMHGICDDVYMSLPCVLGRNGVQQIVNQKLSEDEHKALLKAADVLVKAQHLAECGEETKAK